MSRNQGRKSYWVTKIKPRLFEIAGWCREGHTDKIMCKSLGVSVSTFSKYKAEKPELMEATSVNKRIADLTVENSLFKRANGFTYDESTTEVKHDAEGNITASTIKNVRKTVLPETTAISLWLRNRQSEKWRDKREYEATVTADVKDTRTAEEILKARGIPVPDIGIEDAVE